VLHHFFNLIRNIILFADFDLTQFFDNLVVAYFFGPPCKFKAISLDCHRITCQQITYKSQKAENGQICMQMKRPLSAMYTKHYIHHYIKAIYTIIM